MDINKLLHCHCGSQWKDAMYTVLRVVVGLAFFYHGYVKVFDMGMSNVASFFGSAGIPFPEVMAYLVAYGELLGGLAIMLGLLTHWAGKVGVVIMLGAIGFVHWGAEGGWFFGYGAEGGYEYPLLLLVATAYLVVMGSGRYSLDQKLFPASPLDRLDNTNPFK